MDGTGSEVGSTVLAPGIGRHAPGGTMTIDPKNLHTWKTFWIGRVRADGQFDIVWTWKVPIEPDLYPEWSFQGVLVAEE